jgi:hypothetical protein
MTLVMRTFAMVVGVASLTGCALSGPPMQWWRVGNCLVIYDTRSDNRQVLVAGNQCEIKREEMAAVSGTGR